LSDKENLAYEWVPQNGGIRVKDIHINLHNTLQSGQAFRWRANDEGFFGVVNGHLITAKNDRADLIFEDMGADFFTQHMAHYFDLVTDYQAVLNGFGDDDILKASLSFAPGIRVLNQDPFETLISFIISANNNLPRIQSIVQRISVQFGQTFQAKGERWFAFPTPERLGEASEQALLNCGAGYRARYIIGAASMVNQGFSLEALKKTPYLDARKALTALPGVGTKVADCVLLYALGFKQAFPMDVWVKRVVHEIYGFESQKDEDVRAFAKKHFGAYAGIAQQYLFYYVKANKMR